MTSNATGTIPQRRTRFILPNDNPTLVNDNAVTEPSSNDMKKASPMKVAMSTVAESLASLHPDLKTFLTTLTEKHIKLLIKIRSKQTTISKWQEDESCFPRSIQFKFDLASTSNVETTTAFQQLQENCKKIITKCQSDLKAQMIALLEVEKTALYDQARTSFAVLLPHTIKSVILNTKNLRPISTNAIHCLAIAILKDNPKLLKNMNTGINQFITKYESIHSVELNARIDDRNTVTSEPHGNVTMASPVNSRNATAATSDHTSANTVASPIGEVQPDPGTTAVQHTNRLSIRNPHQTTRPANVSPYFATRNPSPSQSSDGPQPNIELNPSDYSHSNLDDATEQTNDASTNLSQASTLTNNLSQASFTTTDTLDTRDISVVRAKAFDIFKSISIVAWSKYQAQDSINKQQIKILSFTKEASLSKATEDTVSALETETTADYSKIQDLVKTAVEKATKPLHQKIKGLQDKNKDKQTPTSKPKQKNSKPRGTQAPSLKKSNATNGNDSPKNDSTRMNRNRNKQGAGGKRNGTAKDKPTKKRRQDSNNNHKSSSTSKQNKRKKSKR